MNSGPGVGERGGQHAPALGGQRGEQTAAVGEVMGGRGMRHPRRAGQLT